VSAQYENVLIEQSRNVLLTGSGWGGGRGRAVEARPDWAKPHFYLGKTLAALGELSAARTELEAAARIEPDLSQHQYQLAQVYRRLGNVEKAEQHLARYRELVELERKKKTPAEFNVP